MHRLLTDTALLNHDTPMLPTDAARHLRVLRPKHGEAIELFDGHGNWRVYKYDADTARLCAESEILRMPRGERELTLFACVTKGSRWDWTVEKATELGVTRIVPVISERTIVRLPADEREAKRARWLRIAEDAARQSDSKWLPEITAAVDFGEALKMVKKTTCFVGALTDPPSEPLAQAVRDHVARSMAVFVGPEGDFTPSELDALIAVATPTSFGPTVLRAETAAIFAVSVLVSMQLSI